MALRGMLLAALMVVGGGCGDNGGSGSPDLSAAPPTCSEMCSRFLTCTEMADPTFMGSTNALVPCENACFSFTEQMRDDLRACYTKTCTDFIGCAKTAGLKLGMKPAVDMAVMVDGAMPDLTTTD
jgi:hypothetical protein